MGNETSRPTTLYGRVSKAIPPMAPQYGLNENSEWVDKGVKAFASEGDREQFICELIACHALFLIYYPSREILIDMPKQRCVASRLITASSTHRINNPCSNPISKK